MARWFEIFGSVGCSSEPLDDAGTGLVFPPEGTRLIFFRGGVVVGVGGAGVVLFKLGLSPAWGGTPPTAVPATVYAVVVGDRGASPPLACPKVL
jgi:hypothetical protein